MNNVQEKIKNRTIRMAIIFGVLVLYILFLRFIILPAGIDYYAGPLLVLSSAEIPVDVLLVNMLVFLFPVGWLIAFFMAINKKE